MPLLIRHTVEIELSSEFDYKPEMLTLTNHHIFSSKNTNAFLETPKAEKFYCQDCNTDYKLKDSKFRCDDCGGIYDYKTAKEIGESLILCNGCLNSNKSLDFFKIFGKRGPSKTKRETRAREALEDARVEVPAEQMLEEIDAFNIAAEQDRANINAVQADEIFVDVEGNVIPNNAPMGINPANVDDFMIDANVGQPDENPQDIIQRLEIARADANDFVERLRNNDNEEERDE